MRGEAAKELVFALSSRQRGTRLRRRDGEVAVPEVGIERERVGARDAQDEEIRRQGELARWIAMM